MGLPADNIFRDSVRGGCRDTPGTKAVASNPGDVHAGELNVLMGDRTLLQLEPRCELPVQEGVLGYRCRAKPRPAELRVQHPDG